nr:DNA-directed RNA polymerase II subunit RPB1-like [Zonotrichia albicollis]
MGGSLGKWDTVEAETAHSTYPVPPSTAQFIPSTDQYNPSTAQFVPSRTQYEPSAPPVPPSTAQSLPVPPPISSTGCPSVPSLLRNAPSVPQYVPVLPSVTPSMSQCLPQRSQCSPVCPSPPQCHSQYVPVSPTAFPVSPVCPSPPQCFQGQFNFSQWPWQPNPAVGSVQCPWPQPLAVPSAAWADDPPSQLAQGSSAVPLVAPGAGTHLSSVSVCTGETQEFQIAAKSTKRENPSQAECSQLCKHSKAQGSEDRQDGAGQCGAGLSTMGQSSRHSFCEQARAAEERPWVNINHRMLQSPLL